MPWKQTCVMEQRVKFIMDFLEDSYSMAELCEHYNISRKTAYKWLDRYNTDGIEALRNRSRAPHNHPNEMSGQMKDAILSIKKCFPKWGAPKIRSRLERENPRWSPYPAISTNRIILTPSRLYTSS